MQLPTFQLSKTGIDVVLLQYLVISLTQLSPESSVAFLVEQCGDTVTQINIPDFEGTTATILSDWIVALMDSDRQALVQEIKKAFSGPMIRGHCGDV